MAVTCFDHWKFIILEDFWDNSDPNLTWAAGPRIAQAFQAVGKKILGSMVVSEDVGRLDIFILSLLFLLLLYNHV